METDEIRVINEDRYLKGSPVMIRRIALFRDTSDNLCLKVLLMSLSEKKIINIRMNIFLSDPSGDDAGDLDSNYGKRKEVQVKRGFPGLSLRRDDEYQCMVPLPEATDENAGIGISISGIIFMDGSSWTSGEDDFFTPCKSALSLERQFNDPELVKQYDLEMGGNTHIAPMLERGLWYCTCRGINHVYESRCHLCGRTLRSLDSMSLEELIKMKDARLEAERLAEEERIAREKEEKKQARAEKISKVTDTVIKKPAREIAGIYRPAPEVLRKRRLAAALACLILLVMLGAGILIRGFLLPGYDAERLDGYNAAMELYRNSDWKEAARAFEECGVYRDSWNYRRYCLGRSEYEAGNYDSAEKKFSRLGDFLDASDYAVYCATVEKISRGRLYTGELRDILAGAEVRSESQETLLYDCENLIDSIGRYRVYGYHDYSSGTYTNLTRGSKSLSVNFYLLDGELRMVVDNIKNFDEISEANMDLAVDLDLEADRSRSGASYYYTAYFDNEEMWIQVSTNRIQLSVKDGYYILTK